MVHLEVTLETTGEQRYTFTPRYVGGYFGRTDMLVGVLDRELCIWAEASPTGKEECSLLCGLIPRHEIGLDLTQCGQAMVNVIIPLKDMSQHVEHLSKEEGIFAYVAFSRPIQTS
jgi:hypothetical protein